MSKTEVLDALIWVADIIDDQTEFELYDIISLV